MHFDRVSEFAQRLFKINFLFSEKTRCDMPTLITISGNQSGYSKEFEKRFLQSVNILYILSLQETRLPNSCNAVGWKENIGKNLFQSFSVIFRL